MYTRFVFIILAVFTTLSVHADEELRDTIRLMKLDEVVITAKVDQMFSNHNVTTFSKQAIEQYKAKTLAQLINEQSSINVVSYGASGISNVKIRGGQSNHTAVLWNGFNVQDPLRGEFNFGMVNAQVADDVKIQCGGGSAVFGSGAMGGAIHLNNKPHYNSGLNSLVDLQLGSFGKQYFTIGTAKGGKDHYHNIKFFHHRFQNNFEFRNLAKQDFPTELYQNAAQEQFGLLQSNFWRIKGHHISTQLWMQDNLRMIAPNMVTSNTGSFIDDHFNRLAINWNKKKGDNYFEGRLGLLQAQMNYVDPGINLDVDHGSVSRRGEFLYGRTWNKYWQTIIGVHGDFTNSLSDNFGEEAVSMNRTSSYLSNKFNWKNIWHVNLNLRRQFLDGQWKPLTFNFNSKVYVFENVAFSGAFARSHKVPSFNDVFWVGIGAQGNADLLDEYGYSSDFGIHLGKKGGVVEQVNLTYYQNDYINMIQWLPINGVWTPSNQKKVDSKGIELDYLLKKKLTADIKAQWRGSYVLNNATLVEKAENESDEVLGKQLIYMPKHSGQSNITLLYKEWQMNYGVQYNGKTYILANNTKFLYPFWLHRVRLSKDIERKEMDIQLSFGINNLLNEEYMTRVWYPMPGRNFELGINIKLK